MLEKLKRKLGVDTYDVLIAAIGIGFCVFAIIGIVYLLTPHKGKVRTAHRAVAVKHSKSSAHKPTRKVHAKIRVVSKSVVFSPIAKGLSRRPQLPLLPMGKGSLSGAIVILDPGHGGIDPGAPFTVTKDGKEIRFYESANTMRDAFLLADMVRKEGAMVFFTTWSDTVRAFKGAANEPVPVPRDAVFLTTGKQVKAGQNGLDQRILESLKVMKKYRTRRIYFISLHQDSMKPGDWAGGHVIVGDRDHPPLLGVLVASKMKSLGYAREHNGNTVRVLDDRREKGKVRIMRKGVVAQRILVELGIPSDPGDSWRLRSVRNISAFLQKVIVAPLIQCDKQIKKHR